MNDENALDKPKTTTPQIKDEKPRCSLGLTREDWLLYSMPKDKSGEIVKQVSETNVSLETACAFARFDSQIAHNCLKLGEEMYRENLKAQLQKKKKPFDEYDSKIEFYLDYISAVASFEIEIIQHKKVAINAVISAELRPELCRYQSNRESSRRGYKEHGWE